jgi:hypothetical protein
MLKDQVRSSFVHSHHVLKKNKKAKTDQSLNGYSGRRGVVRHHLRMEE